MPGDDITSQHGTPPPQDNGRPGRRGSSQQTVANGARPRTPVNNSTPPASTGGGKGKRQTIAGLAVVVRQQGARVESLEY